MPSNFTLQSAAATVASGAPGEPGTLRHLALIMDGNRRWARRRGLPIACGYERGAARLEELLRWLAATPEQRGIELVTVYAFSESNWQRDASEVRTLMRLCTRTLQRLSRRCAEEGLRIDFIGRRDRLDAALLRAMDQAMAVTATGSRTLRIAFDYSSRRALLNAFQRFQDNAVQSDALAAFWKALSATPDEDGTVYPDVDLLIRTGDEQRLSDFLLWECAYAELYFSDLMWPDFSPEALSAALAWYRSRARRFGR
jgi:undecaprenyl diphosphate synthase